MARLLRSIKLAKALPELALFDDDDEDDEDDAEVPPELTVWPTIPFTAPMVPVTGAASTVPARACWALASDAWAEATAAWAVARSPGNGGAALSALLDRVDWADFSA